MDGTETARVRVVIADDHSLVRRGTKELLEQSGLVDVVAEAEDGVEAVEAVSRHLPDVALLDIGMPHMNGVDAARAIVKQFPDVRVLMLTVHDDAEYVYQAIKSGACGYLMKHASEEELVNGVMRVAAGESVLDASVTALVLDRIREEPSAEPEADVGLTPRELDTLELAAQGLSNQEIGKRLGRSPRTVEAHLHHAFKKLGVRSRTEGVILALKLGIISLEDGR